MAEWHNLLRSSFGDTMLTRKDYIGLCDAMAEGVVSGKFVDSMCAWLGKNNPKFDRAKFEKSLGTMIVDKRKAKGGVHV